MRQTPFEDIKNKASQVLPATLVDFLPDKWEKIGTVVTIHLPDELRCHKEQVGKVYAEVLGCTSVLNNIGGISGVFREPVVELMYGSPVTETIHIENGIRFRLDPQRIMFSSGNLKERIRMSQVSNNHEAVIDLFAGIGYFTLPMAVFRKPKKIYACEINPLAYRYLSENIVLNHVTTIVEPLFGDNQKTAPKECADRVILGYLKDPQKFLTTAFDSLRNHVGIIHYHEVVPFELVPMQPLQHIESAAKLYHRRIELLEVQTIKSYAPGIDHVVIDVKVSE